MIMDKVRICTIFILALVVLFLSWLAFDVHAMEVSTRVYKTIPTDADSKVQSGYGLQLNLEHKGWYLYASQDVNPIRFGGQRGQDVDLQSLGLGFTHSINKNFSFFADIGWYHPKHDSGIQEFPKTQLAEGLYYYLNTQLGITHLWDYYTIEYHGAIGGKFGVAFEKELFNNFSMSLSAAYRYLQLGEMIQGRDYGNTAGWWEYKEDRDFGGWQAGLMFTLKF